MILLAFGLVLLNGFFVATEFAIVKVRESRIRELAAKGSRNARIAEEILSRLDAYLSACQLGITLASLALGWIGEPAFAHLIEPLLVGLGSWAETAAHAISITIAFIIITLLHIVVGELAPKSVAIRYPEWTTLATARPMHWFFRGFYPFIWSLNALAIALLRLFGLQVASEVERASSEEELRLLLAEAGTGGGLAERRRVLLEQAMQLPDRKVREIMIPRTDVAYLDILNSPEELLETARREGYTRYPLCRDHLDDVIGIVHIRELFARGSMLTDKDEIERLAREPLYVPEAASAEQLLRQFQQRRLHMAIVVDEHGGTAGLATLEDVLEELTGEILDEFDVETPPIEDAGNGCVRVAGSLPVVDLARHFDVPLGSEESVTAGGLILEELGRVARVGDVIRVDRLGLRVLETRRRRVERVLVGPYEQVIAARPVRAPLHGGRTG